MLRNAKDLHNYVLEAEDGEIGRCKDFLFDDKHWTVRYMVADTGKWLPGRKVLIPPFSLGHPKWDTRKFPVKLTREQIENAPPIDQDEPVSRLYEKKHFDYFGWPYYWVGSSKEGPIHFPYAPEASLPEVELQKVRQEQENIDPEESHLRSVKEVNGYYIKAVDGEIGHVEDFIFEGAFVMILIIPSPDGLSPQAWAVAALFSTS